MCVCACQWKGSVGMYVRMLVCGLVHCLHMQLSGTSSLFRGHPYVCVRVCVIVLICV